MKAVNIMNFVRRIDERHENSTENLLALTKKQLEMVNYYGVDNTFLLQYDTVCDSDFVTLFKENATDKTELGLWYEIVEPLTSACGIPYNSEKGWKWDWHIIPGYSMAYTPSEREQLIDEAMRKFREVFGCYPKSVAGWVIDTHTLNHLAEHYDISATAICRDQANTDAYTLLGGYFNGAYYPSKNNIFTPAQSKDMQVNVPVFRLLGPCPVHNYDNHRFSSSEFRLQKNAVCFTLEPCWYMGCHEDTVDWLLDSFYSTESLGFAYSQIGQENSFYKSSEQVLSGLDMQIKKLILRGDVEFKKMCDTGEAFRALFPDKTPATAVVSHKYFDTPDVQSVYYDCKNYTANLFRFEDKVFFRSLFLFDERVEDLYLKNKCTTFDAVFENLPVVDTVTCHDDDKKRMGLEVAEGDFTLESKKEADGVLKVCFGDNSVTFFEDRIEIFADKLTLFSNSLKAKALISADGIIFEYKGVRYRLAVEGGDIVGCDGSIAIRRISDRVILKPERM